MDKIEWSMQESSAMGHHPNHSCRYAICDGPIDKGACLVRLECLINQDSVSAAHMGMCYMCYNLSQEL